MVRWPDPCIPQPDPSSTPGALRTVSVDAMQRIDTEAIEQLGIPRVVLMEYAGAALARAVVALTKASGVQDKILVCCGSGYNGGDGMAAARHLQQRGFRVHVALFGHIDRLREEPAVFAHILQSLKIPMQAMEEVEGPFEQLLRSATHVVDALLGIGMRGEVRPPISNVIAMLNASGKPIVSADIPSGLDGDRGVPQGQAVRATTTVAFGLAKQGCRSGQGPAYVGTLMVDDLSLPPHLLTRT